MPQSAFNVNNAKANTQAGPWKSKNYSAATAGDQAVVGRGSFKGINVNVVGAGSLVTVYDGTSTSGKKLGSWSGAALSSFPPDFNLEYLVGLFVVVTATAPDVTVAWLPAN